jgi:hypothetical protein
MPKQFQLRLRLTAIFVAFIAILLATLGFLFRQHLRDEAVLTARAEVEADWGATLGFLHIDNQRPEWVFDRNHPDEAYTVERLRHVYQLTSPEGNILEQSSIFQSIRATRQTPGPRFYNPQDSIARDERGVPYMTTFGWIRDDHNRTYGLSIGRSLAIPYRSADRFVEIYVLLSLPVLALASALSWWLTGIAIRQDRQAT